MYKGITRIQDILKHKIIITPVISLCIYTWTF